MTVRSIVADLQQCIDQIAGGSAQARPSPPFGVAEIEGRFPGSGLALGAHEIAGGGSDVTTGAVFAIFTAGIAGRIPGPIISCLSRPDIFAPALVQVGLGMDCMIFVESNDKEGVVKNAEEGLRYRGVVFAKLVWLPMVASRRFQLAAEQSGDRPYHSS